MRAVTLALRGVALIIIALLVMPGVILAQDAGDSDQAYKFSKEELTQMLAPLVMRWESIFRYAQDIWAPMAAPIVVVKTRLPR